jgi:hypothetical protein
VEINSANADSGWPPGVGYFDQPILALLLIGSHRKSFSFQHFLVKTEQKLSPRLQSFFECNRVKRASSKMAFGQMI